MKSRIAIAVSVLTLGTALAAVPSFAQMRERGSGPEVQQESTGTVSQQESSGCVHFQQGCSDKPYPTAQGTSRNGERTGTRERLGSERVRMGERERMGRERAGERERVTVAERERGEGFGEGRRYYNSEPGVEIARRGGGGIAMCETRFHSFDPATGTYLGFDGIRHPCP